MTPARLGGLVLVALATSACGAPTPTPSSHAAELDTLERLTTSPPAASAPGAQVAPRPAPSANAADTPSRPRNGRPPTLGDFAFDADMARAYIDHEVPKVAAENPDSLEFHVKAAKALVLRLRPEARTAAEKNVAMLLFGILTLEADRHGLARGRQPAIPADARELAAQATACRSELDAWMAVVKADATAPPEGQCLGAMRQAFDMLVTVTR